MRKGENMTYPIGNRTVLAKELPLESPLIVQIFPVYACNFKCEYCIHAVDMEKRGFISECTMMDFDLYKKAIDDMSRFGKKVKMLRFAAMGEPLLHPQIADMVKYAREKDVASSVEIVTNGALLSHELSDALIDAGLSRLRISLEGLSSDDYEKHCGKAVDYDQLKEQIEYFYTGKKETVVYIKIIDYMVKTKEQESEFYRSFERITDQIAIEHLTPTIDEIDYSAMAEGTDLDKPQNGEEILNPQICPMPYYFMQVNPDGNIVACCNTKYPGIIGNIKEQSLYDIWNGEAYNRFRYKMLDGVKQASEACGKCSIYLYGTYQEDLLDDYAEDLKKKYETLLKSEDGEERK